MSSDRRAPENSYELEARNAAVTKIYGAKSPEMTGRFYRIAMDYWLYSKSREIGEKKGLEYFEKSYQIAHAQNLNGDVLSALSQMAIIKTDQNKLAESRALISEIEAILTTSPESLSKMNPCARAIMGYGLAKDHSLTLKLKSLSARSSTKAKGFLDATSIAIIMPLLLISIAATAGLATPFKLWLIFRLCKRAENAFEKSTDLQSAVLAVNRLINLNLYRGNAAGALNLSTRVLRLVGEEPNYSFDIRTDRYQHKKSDYPSALATQTAQS